jgi:poly-gamma-glutamate synthesis protein (capsule biosynthesis protein)
VTLLLALTQAACTTMGYPNDRAGVELTVAFAGDVHFMGRVAALLDRPASALGPAAVLLAANDLTLLNLETPITDGGTAEDKRYLFRADGRSVEALTSAGVDAVSLANNHSMDYGRVGLADTLTAARRGGLGVFGAGADVTEAFTPWRTTVRGRRIAVFGFDQIDDLAEQWSAGPGRSGLAMAFDTDRASAAVSAARNDSDLVIVMPHWGEEGNPCPTALQRAFAARMVAAGADIVVGAHAHVLQGAGYLRGAFVGFGMGNFLWYSGGLFPPRSYETGVLVLKVHGRNVVGFDFEPAVVSDTGRPRMLSGWQARLAQKNYLALRRCTGTSAR